MIPLIETECFLAELARHHYDLRGYAPASLQRRLAHLIEQERVHGLSELLPRLGEQGGAERMAAQLLVSATGFFRDPLLWRIVRQRVLPELAKLERIRIWVAGCASGEEAYSVALLLAEAGLLERSEILATDLSVPALARAQEGLYPSLSWSEWYQRYQQSGGHANPERWIHGILNGIQVTDALRMSVTFQQHHLLEVPPSSGFNWLLCRNVLLYLDDCSKQHVMNQLSVAAAAGAFLWLGAPECLFDPRFRPVDPDCCLYRHALYPCRG